MPSADTLSPTPPIAGGSPDRTPLDWLVVGGGVHGTHVASRLLLGSGRDDVALRILDPGPAPLSEWRRVTRNVGMPYLRSPVVHHLGGAPMDLARFAGTAAQSARARPFRGRYRRPALDLFNAHTESVVREAGLQERWIRGYAERLRRTPDGTWEVEWGEGRIAARNVVLAIGGAGGLAWPKWAEALRCASPSGRVLHVLGEEPIGDHPEGGRAAGTDLVVGAGMSGAQLALRLANAGRKVVLISEADLRVSRFDTDPGWLGPKRMTAFEAERCPDTRRAIITAARHRGTVTEDVHHALMAAQRKGTITHLVGEITAAEADLEGVRLGLHELESGAPGIQREVRAERVLLATGFAQSRPGGAWLDEAVERESLPVAACGYPVPDAALRWSPGLFVMGPLADLELGPVARNIAGARRGAERIMAVAPAVTRAGQG